MAGEARGTVGSNEPEAAHSVRGMGAPFLAASTRWGRLPIAGEGKQRGFPVWNAGGGWLGIAVVGQKSRLSVRYSADMCASLPITRTTSGIRTSSTI
jgi:hypothetical protein